MALSKRAKSVVFFFTAVVVADIVLFALYFRGLAGEAASTGAAEPADARGVELANPRTQLERDDATTAAAEAALPAARAPAEESALGPRFRGRVVIPPGTPEDDEKSVLCGSFASDAGDPLRVAVAEDGTFDARFPVSENEHATGWVELHSRWLVLTEPVFVELARSGGEIVLEPKLGARARCVVRLPPGREDERAFLTPKWVHVGVETSTSSQLELHDRLAFERVEGDVLTAEGWVLAPGRELVFETTRALDPGQKHELWTSSTRFQSESVVLGLVPGAVARAELVLEACVRVRGRVVDAAGVPVAGAEVGGYAPSSRPDSGMRYREERERGIGLTNAEGRFDIAIDAAEAELVVVEAAKRGFLAGSWRAEDVLRGATLTAPDFVLQDARIAGRALLADGSAAAGATVHIFAREPAPGDARRFWEPRDEAKVVVFADGTFELDAPRAGEYRLVANHSAKEAHAAVELASVQPGTKGLELVLAPVPDLVVEVRDDRNQPQLRARVRVRSLALERLGRRMRDGHVVLPGVPDGPWELEVSAPGCADESVDVVLRDAASRVVRVQLQRTATLRGRFVDEHGAGRSSTHAKLRRIDPPLDGVGPLKPAESGAFAFPDLRPGAYRLEPSAGSAHTFEPIELTLAPGELREGLEVRLELGGVLEVEVLDEHGKPDAGRWVSCSRNDSLVADESGRVRFIGLAAGRFRLTREAEFDESEDTFSEVGGLAQLEVVLARGETKHVVLGGPQGKGRKTLVQVVRKGQPVAGMAVLIDDACPTSHEATTDSSGRAALEFHGAGRVGVHAWSEACSLHRTFETGAAPPDAWVLELPTGSVSGRVSGARKLPDVLMLQAVAGQGRDAPTPFSPSVAVEPEGWFSFGCVEPGVYDLRAYVGGGWKNLDRRIEVADAPIELDLVLP